MQFSPSDSQPKLHSINDPQGYYALNKRNKSDREMQITAWYHLSEFTERRQQDGHCHGDGGWEK